MFNLYHITSQKYINTRDTECSPTTHEGKSCTAKLKNMSEIIYDVDKDSGDPITCYPQATPNALVNNCMTYNIWLDKVDGGFPNSKQASILHSSPEHIGDCSNPDYSEASNNWNAPVATTSTGRQSMIFFGPDTEWKGTFYHRDADNENKISHMRAWTIDKNNNDFWTTGLGKGSTDMDGLDGVYQVLADQWPNGPPYKNNNRKLDISFSAPIQYGIIPTYGQKNFSLEAYTWNDNYDSFEGLGFLTTSGVIVGVTYHPLYIGQSDIMTNWTTATNQPENDISYMHCYLYDDRGKLEGPYYLSYLSGSKGNYYQASIDSWGSISDLSTGSGSINFWPNGYVYMKLDGDDNYYWLCQNKLKLELWWISMDGSGYSESFFPVMLAMSWT